MRDMGTEAVVETLKYDIVHTCSRRNGSCRNGPISQGKGTSEYKDFLVI